MTFFYLFASQQNGSPNFFNEYTNDFFKGILESFDSILPKEMADKMLECWKIQLTSNAWIIDSSFITSMKNEYKKLTRSFIQIITNNQQSDNIPFVINNNIVNKIINEVFEDQINKEEKLNRLSNFLKLISINDKFEQLDNHVQSLLLSTRFFYFLEQEYLKNKFDFFLLNYNDNLPKLGCSTKIHQNIIQRLNISINFFTTSYNMSSENHGLLNHINQNFDVKNFENINKKNMEYFQTNIKNTKQQIKEEMEEENESEEISKELKKEISNEELLQSNLLDDFSDLLHKIACHQNCCTQERIKLSSQIMIDKQKKLEILDNEIFCLNQDYEQYCSPLKNPVNIKCIVEISSENKNLCEALTELLEKQFKKFEINQKIYTKRLLEFQYMNEINQVLYLTNILYKEVMAFSNKYKNKTKSQKKRKNKIKNNNKNNDQDYKQDQDNDQLPEIQLYQNKNISSLDSIYDYSIKTLDKLFNNSLGINQSIYHIIEHITQVNPLDFDFMNDSIENNSEIYKLALKDIKNMSFKFCEIISLVTPVVLTIKNKFNKLVNNIVSVDNFDISNDINQQINSVYEIYHNEINPDYKSTINLFNKYSFLSVKYKKIFKKEDVFKTLNIQYFVDLLKLKNNTEVLSQYSSYSSAKKIVQDITQQSQFIRLGRFKEKFKKDLLKFSDLLSDPIYNVFTEKYQGEYRKETDSVLYKIDENKKLLIDLLSFYQKSHFSSIKILLKCIILCPKLNRLEAELNILNTKLSIMPMTQKIENNVKNILHIESDKSNNDEAIIVTQKEDYEKQINVTLKIVNLDDISDQINSKYDNANHELNLNNSIKFQIQNNFDEKKVGNKSIDSFSSLSSTRENTIKNQSEKVFSQTFDQHIDIKLEKENQYKIKYFAGKNEINFLKQQNQYLKQQLNLKTQETSDLINALNTQNEKQINNINSLLNISKQENFNLKQKLAEDAILIKQIETEKEIQFNKNIHVINLKNENSNLIKENKILKQQMISLQESIGELNNSCRNLKNEKDLLNKQIIGINLDLEKINKEKKSYINTNNYLQNLIKEYSNTINENEKLIKELKQDKSECFNEKSILIDKLKEYELLQKQQNNEIKELTQSNTHLKNDLIIQNKQNILLKEENINSNICLLKLSFC